MIEIIKRSALEAVKESNPAAIMFGTVVSTRPLKIDVEQRLILEEQHLILTSHVRDFEVDMTVDHFTEEASSHTHAYTGKKIFKVHLGLSVGEKVVLIRVQGGQKYIVLDRVR